MKLDWAPVRRALAQLRSDGAELPIWWRDDDAIKPTSELDRLARDGASLGVPVHIAVIPDRAEATLPPLFRNSQTLIPLVHGWRHQRHLLKGKKDTEFGLRRPGDVRELGQALARMQMLFGDNLLPIFVPPWNMIADSLVPELAMHGYLGLSTYTPRTAREPVSGLVQVNTHLDPIDWRGGRGLVDPEALIEHLVCLIDARREGTQDKSEPLGVLTHHLEQTEEVWRFTRECLSELLAGGAVPTNLRAKMSNLP